MEGLFFRLAWRNVWRNPRRSIITISAVASSVVFAVFIQSLSRGTRDGMIDNLIRHSTGYMQIQDYRFQENPSMDNVFFYDDRIVDRIRQATPSLDLVLPRIDTFMLAAGEQVSRGAMVSGIDADKEHRFSNIRDYTIKGRFFTPGEAGAVIGRGLAERLGLGLGESLVLIGKGRFGMSASGIFPIVGVVDHPLPKINQQVVYLPLETAQALLSAKGYVSSLQLVPGRKTNTESIAGAIRKELENEDLRVYTWQDFMPEFLNYMKIDMAGAYLMSFILYIVVGFGFFGTVLTMTMNRLKEFAILLSIGMSRSRLAVVVLLETFCISLIGVICGIVAAFGVICYFYRRPLELKGNAAEALIERGWSPELFVSFAPDLFYVQGIIIFFIAMAVFLYPLIKISTLDNLKAAKS